MEYSIWLMEYAFIPNQPVGSILYGHCNQGTRYFPMTYLVVKGGSHTILVDTGVGNTGKTSLALQKRDNIVNWRSPDDVLAKLSITPAQVDTIIMTHAHFDHMDNLEAFPNADVYIQKREYDGWREILRAPQAYRGLLKAINPDNIQYAETLLSQGKLRLLDGPVTNLIKGVSVEPAYDGHSFASQIVTIERDKLKPFVVTGDLIYSQENLVQNDGSYVPVGLGIGSQLNMVKTMERLAELADGDLSSLIIGHDAACWELYPSCKGTDGLWMAEIQSGGKG